MAAKANADLINYHHLFLDLSHNFTKMLTRSILLWYTRSNGMIDELLNVVGPLV